MSIKDKKLEYITEEIVHQQIKNGILPTSYETIYKVIAATSSEDLSLPTYKFTDINSSIVSSSEHIKFLDAILKDLQIIYDNYLDMQNQFLVSTRSYEVERKKLEAELQLLEDELKEKIIVKNDGSALNSVYDTFINTDKINSSSTINVNIESREVGLSSRGSHKISADYITDISFSPKTVYGYISNNIEYGSLYNIINNQANQTWLTQTSVSNNNGTFKGELTIDFGDGININTIELDPYITKPMYVLIRYSPDGINTLSLPYHEEAVLVNNKTAFSFPEVQVKKLILELSKSQADDNVINNNKDQYIYRFGLNNISFYNIGYTNIGELISTPLTVENDSSFVINKAKLEVDSIIPSGTSIDYYIALNKNPITWYPISASEDNTYISNIIDFRNVSDNIPVTFRLDSNLSLRERELPSLKANGISFYNLGTVGSTNNPIDIISGSEKLYKGVGSWEVREYDESNNTLATTYSPKIEDWFGKDYNCRIRYVDVASKLFDNVATSVKTSYKLSLTFNCNKKTSVKIIPICNYPMSIYINTKLTYESINQKEAYILFDKGFNQIDVLVYKHNILTPITLDLNYDLQTIGNSFYASSSPMKLVSLFDLQYKVPNTNHNSYAITKINDRNVVVVNSIVQDINYEFHYRYGYTDTNDGVLFKAVFNNPNYDQYSPKLKSYRIKFI